MQIKPDEITSILKSRIEGLDTDSADLSEVGTVLSVADDSYYVASKVHDLNVKTRPDDTQKIALIRDLIAQHVDVEKILEAL